MATLPLRRSLTCTLAALALSGGAMLGLTPSASAGVCGEHQDPWISGAKAYWDISCSDGKVTVSGWVEDTAANRRCAKVQAIFPNGDTTFSAPACPKGDREYFQWTSDGHSADVYLYEYDV